MSVPRFHIKIEPMSAVNHLTAFRSNHLAILGRRNWSFLHQYCLALFLAPQGPVDLAANSDADFEALLSSAEINGVPSLEKLNSIFAAQGLDPLSLLPTVLDVLRSSGESSEAVDALLAEGNLIFKGQVDVLRKAKDQPEGLYVRLDAPFLMASSRFSRSYGSQCFLRLKLGKDATTGIAEGLYKEHVKNLLSKPMDVAGRRFQGFWSTDEKSRRTIHCFAPDVGPTSRSPKSLAEFVNAHVDLSIPANRQAKFPKTVSRFALGLSSSTPTITFKREDILLVPDLEYDSLAISFPVMKAVSERLRLKWMPSIIEGIVDGRRETWALDYSTWATQGAAKAKLADRFIELFLPNPLPTSHIAPCILFKIYDISGGPPRVLTQVMHAHEVSVRWRARDSRLTRSDPDRKFSVMSDGCGQISLDAMKGVRESLNEMATPSSCQFRLGGAKGMLTTPPRQDDRPGHWVEVRPSQLKYFNAKWEEFELQVLRVPKSEGSGPSKISKQPIEVLSNGRVPNSVFQRLLELQVKPLITELVDGLRVGVHNPVVFLDTVFSTGMLSERHARTVRNVDPRAVRASQRRHERDSDEEFGNPNEYLNGSLDPYSGAPNTLPEMVASAISFGVSPTTDPVLATKIKLLGKLALNKILEAGQLRVEDSVHLRVTVDVLGILEADEISVRFSETRIQAATGSRYQVVTGPCVVFRSPCIAASDIQKVVAVDHPAFAHRLDEVIFSRKGNRALCSLLSGGDYDGDSVTVCWDRELDKEHLVVDSRPVSEVLHVSDDGEIKMTSNELSIALLSSIWTPSRFGMINGWWTILAYEVGLEHEKTHLSGHLFCRLLDGEKQGLSITDESFKHLKKELTFGLSPPSWTLEFGPAEERAKKAEKCGERVRRKGKLHPADALIDSHRQLVVAFLTAAHRVLHDTPLVLDADFLAPWIQALQKYESSGIKARQRWKNDLKTIYEHVKRVKEKHSKSIKPFSGKDLTTTEARLDYKAKLRPVSAALWSSLDSLASSLATPLLSDEVGRQYLKRVIASCVYAFLLVEPPKFITSDPPKVYHNTFEDAGSMQAFRWSWDVAHVELGNLKADAEQERASRPMIGVEAAGGTRAHGVVYPILNSLKPDRGVVRIERRKTTPSASIQGGQARDGPPQKKPRLSS